MIGYDLGDRVNEIRDYPAKGDRMNEIVILNPDMPGIWVWVIGSNKIVIQNQDVRFG